MTHIAGSNGAGQTAYRLTIKNTGQGTCRFEFDHAKLFLYKGTTTSSRSLPSDTIPKGKKHALTIAPGGSAHARVTFSPDIPGKNEPQNGRCEPVAHSVSAVLTVSSARADLAKAFGPIEPPTSVCEHGRMEESPLH
jgi:hypothetical protein